MTVLIPDRSIDCTSRIHKKMLLYAAFCVLLFPVGFTLVFALVLARARNQINPPAASEEAALARRAADPSIVSFQQLFAPYRPHLWYFEVIETLRRIVMLGGLVSFKGLKTRAVLGLSFAIFTAVLYREIKPYTSKAVNNISFTANWLVRRRFPASIARGVCALDSNVTSAQVVLVYMAGVMIVAQPCGYKDSYLAAFLVCATLALLLSALRLQIGKAIRQHGVLAALAEGSVALDRTVFSEMFGESKAKQEDLLDHVLACVGATLHQATCSSTESIVAARSASAPSGSVWNDFMFLTDLLPMDDKQWGDVRRGLTYTHNGKECHARISGSADGAHKPTRLGLKAASVRQLLSHMPSHKLLTSPRAGRRHDEETLYLHNADVYFCDHGIRKVNVDEKCSVLTFKPGEETIKFEVNTEIRNRLVG